MKLLKSSALLLLISVVLTSCDSTKGTQSDASEVVTAIENAGTYEDYSSERFDELLGSERFILFFHADWCPTCRALEADIKSDLGVLNQHVLLEANYDKEVDLKKEYEINSQSTVIFFNADGSVHDTIIFPPTDQIRDFFE